MNGYPRFGWVDILRFQQPKIEEVADKALKLIHDNPDALGKYENLKEFLKDFDECRYKFSEMSHAIVSNEN